MGARHPFPCERVSVELGAVVAADVVRREHDVADSWSSTGACDTTVTLCMGTALSLSFVQSDQYECQATSSMALVPAATAPRQNSRGAAPSLSPVVGPPRCRPHPRHSDRPWASPRHRGSRVPRRPDRSGSGCGRTGSCLDPRPRHCRCEREHARGYRRRDSGAPPMCAAASGLDPCACRPHRIHSPSYIRIFEATSSCWSKYMFVF